MNIKRYYKKSTLKKHYKNFNVDVLLVQSANAKYFEGVKYAIENGATIHTYDDLALYNCVNTSDINEDIFKYLIDNGAKITEYIEHSMSFTSDNNELIKYAMLHDYKVTINSFKKTLYNKNYELIDIFIHYVDEINQSDINEINKLIHKFKIKYSDDDIKKINYYIELIENKKRLFKLKKIMNE